MRTSPNASEQFYGLRSRAFSLTPDLRFAYQSQSHTRALDQVTAALRNREGLIIVTGEVGTGKTMLCRTLLETFETRMFQSVILDPLLTVEDLLYQVLSDFGLINESRPKSAEPFTEVTRHTLVATLQKFLASLIPLDAYAVIMIDEAQHLGPQVLEEIRLLSNFETDQAKLLQIVLVGQPNLDGLLRRPDMRQLNQRVARRLELEPLSVAEVGDYIERRLLVASQPVSEDAASEETFEVVTTPALTFTPEAVEAVAGISGGVPRLVNTLCDRAIDSGFERQIPQIDVDAVLSGAEHLKLPVPVIEGPARTRGLWKLYTAAAILAVAALGIAVWYRRPIPAVAPTASAPAPISVPAPAPNAEASAPPGAPAENGAASATPPPAARPATQTPPPAASVTASPAPPAPAAATSAPAANTPSPAAAVTPLPPDAFQIFVASFRTAQRAEEVADEVRVGAGLPVTTRLDSTGRWYSIIAGPFKTTDEARTAQARLERLGYAETRVTPTGPSLR